MNIPNILREEILIALRDGAFYGVLLSDNNSAFIQQLDPDYCRITSICDGSFLYKVDMTKIASKLEFFPAELRRCITITSRRVTNGKKFQLRFLFASRQIVR